MIGWLRQWLQRFFSAERAMRASQAKLEVALAIDRIARAESLHAAHHARACAEEARAVIAEATAQAERRLHGHD